MGTIATGVDPSSRTTSKMHFICAIMFVSAVALLAVWQITLIFSINELEKEIDTLTKQLSLEINRRTDSAPKASKESHQANLDDKDPLGAKKSQGNADVSIRDIIEGSVNTTGFIVTESSVGNVANSRVKRGDTDLDGSRNGRTNPSANRDTCVVPKLLNLELSVYARSVEVATVRQIDRWSLMRGPAMDTSVRLDSRSHIQDDGSIVIQHQGMYLVYAQLTFGASRRAQRIGFYIQKNRSESIAKCIDQEHGLDTEDGVSPHAARQCYTSVVTYLSHRDRLAIMTTYEDQSIYPNRDMSFWGLVKLTC